VKGQHGHTMQMQVESGNNDKIASTNSTDRLPCSYSIAVATE